MATSAPRPFHASPRGRRNDHQVHREDAAQVPAVLPRRGQGEHRVVRSRRDFQREIQYLQVRSWTRSKVERESESRSRLSKYMCVRRAKNIE